MITYHDSNAMYGGKDYELRRDGGGWGKRREGGDQGILGLIYALETQFKLS